MRVEGAQTKEQELEQLRQQNESMEAEVLTARQLSARGGGGVPQIVEIHHHNDLSDDDDADGAFPAPCSRIVFCTTFSACPLPLCSPPPAKHCWASARRLQVCRASVALFLLPHCCPCVSVAVHLARHAHATSRPRAKQPHARAQLRVE